MALSEEGRMNPSGLQRPNIMWWLEQMRSVEESNIHMAKPTCHNIKMQDVICHVSQCHITISYLHVRCDVGKMLLNTYMMWNDNAWMQRSLKNADPPKPLISPKQANMCFFWCLQRPSPLWRGRRARRRPFGSPRHVLQGGVGEARRQQSPAPLEGTNPKLPA